MGPGPRRPEPLALIGDEYFLDEVTIFAKRLDAEHEGRRLVVRSYLNDDYLQLIAARDEQIMLLDNDGRIGKISFAPGEMSKLVRLYAEGAGASNPLRSNRGKGFMIAINDLDGGPSLALRDEKGGEYHVSLKQEDLALMSLWDWSWSIRS